MKAGTGVLVAKPDLSFESFAEDVFLRYSRNWKPGTLAVNRIYLRNQILPFFRGRSVAEIRQADVRSWMASLAAVPAAANRSLPVLSIIMEQAELYGVRSPDSNPCRGVQRFPQPGRERFLKQDEMRNLGSALSASQEANPILAALVKLLILTGCRQGEIRTLRWQDYRQGGIFLGDSKTGPRRVWLSSPAAEVLEHLPKIASWTFPGANQDQPMPTETLYRYWRCLRSSAGLADLRLHDLRHNYASFASRRGETVPTIARLLGHRNPSTTLKYTHLADGALREAAEKVGAALCLK